MPRVEAASKKGAPIIKEMKKVTGLIDNQVRHRRESDIYKKYLNRAIREQKDTNLIPNCPSCSPARANTQYLQPQGTNA